MPRTAALLAVRSAHRPKESIKSGSTLTHRQPGGEA